VDILGLATLCKLAIEGGNKALEAYKKTRLSKFEKELLTAAAANGKFFIVHIDEHPGWIKIGRENFPDDVTGDPAITEAYLEAFESLCKRGYIRPDAGQLFRLTSKGFEKARKLAPESSNK